MFSEQKNNYCTVACEYIFKKCSFSFTFGEKLSIFSKFIHIRFAIFNFMIREILNFFRRIWQT
jgi:hypothetical protein